ncbi:MAG: divalent metal cation transporter [Parcubacteria group bacterium]|nr:divalent metal cation transporter [Parcubacteria group bacterium]
MKQNKNFFTTFFKKIGPGFIAGAADDDPSGIATYAQTGAQFGLSQLWTPLYSLPFMIALQEMCGRIGLVTGNGLSGILKKHYSKILLYSAVGFLFIANTINIGADLGAMAATSQLLFPSLPFLSLLIGFTAFVLILEIFVPYARYAQFLKYFAFSLFAYVASALFVRQDWGALLRAAVLPHFSFEKEYILNIVAVLGTTISPYLFFWQADEEVEEEIKAGVITGIGEGKPKISKRGINHLHTDTIMGMFFSNLIMFFIIATAASALQPQGIFAVDTAAQAAEALRPIAGNFASLLFTLGIIGVGLLAVPILAGSIAYAVAEAVGWKAGLFLTFKEAKHFYGVIIAATGIGVFINMLGIPPFKMLYYTAVLNGIIAPPLILLILLICNNKKIMGSHTNSPLQNLLGISIAIIMFLATLALFITSF